ncbi:hypothetical protein ABB02_01998 [Clostridiaceae bacterium JG1575]|nr:hypothetical protein ABB02_01998 [Clostridiaceae bacterium JG1575]
MKLFQKIKDLIGPEDTLDDPYYEDEELAPLEPARRDNVITPKSFTKSPRDSIQSPLGVREGAKGSSSSLCISKPERYEEAAQVVEEVRSGRILVLNLSALDVKIGQRFLDFVSGAAFALEGDIQEVMENVYVVSPRGINMKGMSSPQDFRSLYRDSFQ